nr:MAG TPA: hypothetical protein [Caudoviricetes sp.]
MESPERLSGRCREGRQAIKKEWEFSHSFSFVPHQVPNECVDGFQLCVGRAVEHLVD